MVRSQLLTFLLLTIFLQFSFAQRYKEREKNMPLLVIENQELFGVLDSIITFEKKYCDSYSNERIYIIECDVIDSLITIVTIKSDYLHKILPKSLCGVFEYNDHLFFVSQSLNNIFKQTEEVRIFKLKTINQFHKGRKRVIILDDSLTKWTYVLKNGKFIFGSKKGQCNGME